MARTLKKDIQAKVNEIQKRIDGGMTVLKACEGLLAYPTYLKHRGGTSTTGSNAVQKAMKELEKAIRAEVVAEITQKLGRS